MAERLGPNQFKEQDLLFDFGAGWRSVVPWDADEDHKGRIRKQLDGTKAVDFLAVHGKHLYLIEVKDGRTDKLAFQQGLKSDELFKEVGRKVRDSLAGLVGVLHVASNEEKWRPFREALLHSPIRVVLWLEGDFGPSGHQLRDVLELKDRLSKREEQLQKRVEWLTPRALVANIRLGGHRELPELRVSNLPGAGQRQPTDSQDD